MDTREIDEIEDCLISSLMNYSASNQLKDERLFRIEFHTKYFEKLKELWGANQEIKTKLSVNYGLIHNSIHAQFGVKPCEIADFLLIVRYQGSIFGNSVLLQVKSKESRDNNQAQKKLYSTWPEFTFSQPQNKLFLNDTKGFPEKIKFENIDYQALYFEYSKNNIQSPNCYSVKNCILKSDGTYKFSTLGCFSNFLLNFLLNRQNFGRQFLYSPAKYNLMFRKKYSLKRKLRHLGNYLDKGIFIADDWDFVINSIYEYSNPSGMMASGHKRLKNTLLGFLNLTENVEEIKNYDEIVGERSLRIVEIKLENKK